MLLAIDIGNTNIVVALFHDEEFIQDWRMYTDDRRTADEYSSILLSLFRDAGISLSAITDSILSTVVPTLLGPFIRLAERMTGKKPIVINHTLFPKLPISIPETAVHEIGTDLVCNAVAAYIRFQAACIIADFGTALTFTAVGSNGDIKGIAIAPGLGTAVRSLFTNTAQLPSVPLETPLSSLGTNTTHSIQSGIVLGYKGLVESLVTQMKSDMNESGTINVIATGGLNSVLKPLTTVFQEVDKMLTLTGLMLIAKICSEKETN